MKIMLPSVSLIFILLESVQNANILGIFPVPSPSHFLLSSTLMNALADKGHNVTMISPFEQKNRLNNTNLHNIVLPGFYKTVQDYTKQRSYYQMGSEYLIFFYMSKNCSFLSEIVLNHAYFKNFTNTDKIFDVVIVEEYYNEALHGLANYFNAPLISFTTMGASTRVNSLTGNPVPLSYIPEFFLTYSFDMTFYERLINTFTYIAVQTYKTFILLPKQEQILKKYLPNSPDFYDLYYNTSLVLLNSHPSLNQPIPLVPNMIEIGGFHLKPPKKLPEDLQEFLDSAKDGAIYFSMGTNLKSTQMPIDKRKAILNTFLKLKQQILWKWEDNQLPGKPKNVKIAKWLPQQDILAHPNIKLFITHGGLLSTIETIYYGIPILAIPILSDQSTNAFRSVNDGYALKLDYSDITEEKLTKAINELLSNPKYRATAQFRSKFLHDQQVKPLDRAIYWVEYIIRHKGADHLRVAGLRFPWYKYHLLDVIAFTLFITITIPILLYLLIKNRIFSK